MPARRDPVEFERISAQELVDATYPMVTVPFWVGKALSAVIIYLVTRVALGHFFELPAWTRLPCLVFAVAFSVLLTSGKRPAALIEGTLSMNRRIPTERSQERGDRLAIAHVHAKMWVCKESAHKNLLSGQPNIRGEQAKAQVPVEYKYVVSVVRVNGNEVRVAFSTGEAEMWHPRSYMFVVDESRSPIECPAAEMSSPERLGAPALLERLASILYEHEDDYVPAPKLRQLLACGRDDEDFEFALDRAINAGASWKLLGIDENTGALQLSKAGVVWHEASPEFQARKNRKNKGSRTRPGGKTVTFNIENFSGILNYAHRDNTGDSKVSRAHAGAGMSDEQVRDALRQLLQSDEIPWDREELREVRGDLEEAVEVGDSNSTAVRKAFSRLQYVVGQLALGVAGNHAYQLLVSHFAQKG